MMPDRKKKQDFETSLSHYRLIKKIGAGGMGEIYLAHDTNLDRKVALKLLPEKLTNDPKDLLRFKQEAHAASALNHPYILAIFDFGESAGGQHFIVSEFVEGKTLNRFCADSAPDLLHKLDILIRIASALSAAHEAGIIHRDIKPENIIVRPDGYVKVLDFGLAKLIEGYKTSDGDSESPTLPLVQTNPGGIMGTASYMSPEQARGKNVDARSDIFSFGIVVYEVIAGHLPFKGESAMEMIAAILHQEPEALTGAGIPQELKRIVEKALKKNRNERYQTMKDMWLDLKELRRELDFQFKLEHSREPLSEKQTQENSPAVPTGKIPGKTVQNTEQVQPAPRQTYFLQVIFVVLLAAAVAISIWYLMTGWKNGTASPGTFSAGKFKILEITNWANSAGELSSSAAFSGDGKFVAYGSTASGTTSIWVKQTNTGDSIQVTKDEYYNRFPVWSPNGEEIVYYSKRGDSHGLWRVSLMGSQPKPVAANVDSESKPVLWGKSGRIYFQGSFNLFAVDEATGGVEMVTDFPSAGTPARIIKISPDESRIAFLIIENGVWKIKVKPVDGAQAADVLTTGDLIDNIIWRPDGKTLLFSRKTHGFYQIFAVDPEEKSEPVQLSSGDSDSFVQDISADGSRILYNTVTESVDLWRVDTAAGTESLAASQIDAELWADIAPDSSRVAYQSIKHLRQGSNLLKGSIMVQPVAKESEALRLAEEGFLPQWSPDGRTIAFLKVVDQKTEIWTVSHTGDSLKRLSAGGADFLSFSITPYMRTQVKHLTWAPDGSALAFPSTRDGVSNIWTVSADGTSEKAISVNQDKNQVFYSPVWTAEGKKIAYASRTKQRDDQGNIKHFIWVFDTPAKEQKKMLETGDSLMLLGWTPSENELVFAVKKDDRTFTLTPPEVFIRAVSLETGQQRELTVLKNAYFNNIHLSPDRREIAFSARSSDKDEIWIAPLAGAAPRRLNTSNDPRLFYSSLAWAPDGKTIFFGKQIRFTRLSMLIDQKASEEQK